MTGKKQVAADVALNIVATVLPLCVLQLVILPIMAQDMKGDEYGLVVTVLSIFTVLPGVFGTALNNVRLIFQNKYIEKDECGDFNIILLAVGMLCAIACIILLVLLGVNDPVSLLLLCLASLTWISREYFLVAFRLEIDYKSILICNIVQVIGYVFGYGLFLVFHQWVLVYLVGQGMSLGYILLKSDLHREPFRLTKLFKSTVSDVCALSVSQFLSKFMAYSDRILLYPVIGGTSVGVYYVSTLVGKIVSMAVNPVNGVMLTYLSKNKSDNKSKRAFCITMVSAFVVCVAAYCVVMIFGYPVLAFLYPAYVDEAMVYLPVTSITALVYVLISVAQPFSLKYYSMKWQIVINGATCFIYVLLGIQLLNAYGLMGFCVGALTANVVKLLIMLAIYVFMKPDSKSLQP